MLLGNVHTGLCLRRCARGKCTQRVANRIEMVVSRWLWVVGLRRCARGKCIQRVANRIVVVVSRWLWVVGLRRFARGKCMQRVANRIVMVVSRWVWVVGDGKVEIEIGKCFNRKVTKK